MTSTSISQAAPPEAELDGFLASIFDRTGLDHLQSHLEDSHNISIEAITKLDVGVYHVSVKDDSDWVARIYPSARPLGDVQAEAKLLQILQSNHFPAERCANAQSVTQHFNQPVLVTKFIDGRKPQGAKKAFYKLGSLLGQLQSVDVPHAETRKGGAWHHIALLGGPKNEIDAALSLLAAFKRALPEDKKRACETLAEALVIADDLEGLPHALVHPDLVLSNAIVSPETGINVIDWSGAGVGPRLAALGWALWAAGKPGLDRFDAFLVGYLEGVRPTDEELSRLAGALALRPLVLGVWEVCTRRREPEELVHAVEEINSTSKRLAARARAIAEKREQEKTK